MTDKVIITQLVAPDAGLRTIELDVEHVAIIPLSQDYDRMALRIESEGRTVGLFSSVVSVQVQRATTSEYDVTVTGPAVTDVKFSDVTPAVSPVEPVEDQPVEDQPVEDQPVEPVSVIEPASEEELRKMKLPELKELAAKKGLPAKGNKPEILAALLDHYFPRTEEAPADEDDTPEPAGLSQVDESTGFFPQAPPVAPQPAPQAPQQPVAPPQPPTTGSTPFNF